MTLRNTSTPVLVLLYLPFFMPLQQYLPRLPVGFSVPAVQLTYDIVTRKAKSVSRGHLTPAVVQEA
jgi:hypothetical protein